MPVISNVPAQFLQPLSHHALYCRLGAWPGGAGGARIGCGTGGGGALDIGETSAKRLSAKAGTGLANDGLGSPKGLNELPAS